MRRRFWLRVLNCFLKVIGYSSILGQIHRLSINGGDLAKIVRIRSPSNLNRDPQFCAIYDPSFYEDYRIVPDSFPAICALYYDQFARYGDREAAKERTRLLLTQT